MRHLYGLALAVGMTLVMFFGGGWAYLQLLRLPVLPGQTGSLPANGGSLLSDHSALVALGVLVAIAVLAGLLATLQRISPLATGLTGIILLAWTAIFLMRVKQAVSLIPLRSHSFGAGWEGLLFNGVLAAVGAVMLIPMFIPSRWREVAGESRNDGGARAQATPRESASDPEVDEYLGAMTGSTPAVAQDAKEPAAVGASSARRGRSAEEPPLVGNVLPRRADWPADAMRITGANQRLDDTGSFRAGNASGGRRQGPPGGGLLGDPYQR